MEASTRDLSSQCNWQPIDQCEKQNVGSLMTTHVSVSYVPAQLNGFDQSFACSQSKGTGLRAKALFLIEFKLLHVENKCINE